MAYPSPDYSTFPRFRKHLSKEAMIKINSELHYQFHQQGLSINEGVAVDTKNDFILPTNLSPSSKRDLKNLRLFQYRWIGAPGASKSGQRVSNSRVD